MSEQATETGPLTVDAAIASLLPTEPVEQEAPEAPQPAAEEPEPSEGETSTPEDPEAEPEEPAEGETETEEEAEAVEPVDPPKYWSKDAKEAFAKLPADLQAVVLAQEGPREEAAAKAKAEAAEKVQRADAEVQKVSQLAERLAEFLPQAIQTFASRWGSDPDWVAYAQEHGAEAMTFAKAQHDQELQQLQKVAAAKADADDQAHQAFVKAEFVRLAEVAPDLADPQEGKARRSKVTDFLVKQGVDPDSLRNISAAEMSIAYDAMRFREAQAQLKAPKPLPKPHPAPAKAAARPGAAQTQSPTERTAAQVANRFAQTRSFDDAVALLLAKKA